MDHQDLPSEGRQKAPEHQAVASRTRGRPRKAAPEQTTGSDAPAVASFSIPARPEVEEAAPQNRSVFVVIPYRAIHSGITSGAFRTLAQIASYANKNGFTWVSQQRLAREKGVSIQAISKHVLELKAAGLIEETAKAFWGGPTPRSSTMRIIFDPTMSAEDVIARDSGREDKWGQVEVEPISRTGMGDETSSRGEAVKPVLDLTPAELTIVSRYRAEGLEPPTGARLAAEAAQIKA